MFPLVQTATCAEALRMSETLSPDPATPRAPTGEELGVRKRILLVDDDAALRELIALALTSAGYHVDGVGDGREALQFLARTNVDLVISDLCMPHIDGIELAMEMRKTRPKVPLIAISGGAVGETESILRAVKLLGAKRTLPKPFALRDLTSAVAEVLAGVPA